MKIIGLFALLLSSCVLHRELPKPVEVREPEPIELHWARPNETEAPVEEPTLIAWPRKVLVVGDSEACAVGAIAPEITTHAVKVSCSSGTTIQDWTGRKLTSAIASAPGSDVVIVFLGGNNIVNEDVDGIDQIIDAIWKHGADCVWVSNAALFDKKWRINELMKAHVGERCKYLDSEELPLNLPDKLHPDRASARLWLNAALELMPKIYKEVK